MLLNRLLNWILNNRVFLALQDFLVSPVLRRLSSGRYERVRYQKNLLFKVSALGAGTLAWRHLAKGNIDLSVRYACEIVANQGYIFYSQNWKAYLLYVGLIHAHRRDFDQASLWLAEGITKQKTRLLNSVRTQSYPDTFHHWLDDNVDSLDTVEGWRALFEDAAECEESLELLLIYISTCIFALQLVELVVTFFDTCEMKHHSDWKKMIVYRQNVIRQSRYNKALSHVEIWNGTYPDTSQKLAISILHKTLSTTHNELPDIDEDLHALAQMRDYGHVSHALFTPIMKACNLVNRARYRDAAALMGKAIQDKSEFLGSTSSRAGPTKLFLAGFGWSGSSAVHDACRGYDHTRDMPGAGDLPALNIGADSEPMLHQGAGSLQELVSDIRSSGRISEAILGSFFKNHMLLMPSFNYLEYKTVNACRSIIDSMGFDNYYLLICAFLHDYAKAMQDANPESAIDAAESLQENIVNTMFDDEDIVFFNNSVFAHRARILEHVRGRSYYIVVNRGMADQFCDQMRSNKFFNATFLEFYLVKLSRVVSYTLAKKTSSNPGVKFIDIRFEDWVQDASLRESIAREICGDYDAEIEARYFQPEKSARNINISRDHLGRFDRTCLGMFEKLGLSL